LTLFWLILLPAFAYQVLSIVASLRQHARHPSQSGFQPPVSILKPIHGLDPGMYEALASHARQEYPEFEILLGVRDDSDPSIPHIRRLQREFPEVPISLIVGADRAANGKVGMLCALARHARHSVWLVNDSDIRVAGAYLRDVISPLEHESIGLVTCLYRAIPHSLPGSWEAFGISIDFMPSTLVAPMVGIREFGLGSTLCFHSADLLKAGGFEVLSDYIADDFQLARRILHGGKRAHLSTNIVETSLGDTSWRGAWRHQLRWARTIRFSKGWGYLGLPITHAGIWAIAGFALHIWLAAVILLVARIAAAVVSGWLVLRIRRPLWHALLAPLWDLCAFSVWATSYASTEVQWRDRRLRILRNGRVEEISPR
jgi:ceramide glucosyltransferase